MKLRLSFVMACALVAATQTASAIPITTLTLTEVSSTQLDWSWSSGGSGSVIASPDDRWHFTLSNPVAAPDVRSKGLSGAFFQTADPEGVNLFNTIHLLISDVVTVDVWSDVARNADALIPNGDSVSAGSFNVVFYDNATEGNSASVPDGGCTVTLLALSAGALGFWKRNRPATDRLS